MPSLMRRYATAPTVRMMMDAAHRIRSRRQMHASKQQQASGRQIEMAVVYL